MFKNNSLPINRKDEMALPKWYIILYFMQLPPLLLLGQLLQAGYEDCLVARRKAKPSIRARGDCCCTALLSSEKMPHTRTRVSD